MALFLRSKLELNDIWVSMIYSDWAFVSPYLLGVINYELIWRQSEAVEDIDEVEDLVLKIGDKEAILIHEDHTEHVQHVVLLE